MPIKMLWSQCRYSRPMQSAKLYAAVMHTSIATGVATHIIMVNKCCAGVHNAMVVQQLDVAGLQHVVHSQLNAVGQILKCL